MDTTSSENRAKPKGLRIAYFFLVLIGLIILEFGIVLLLLIAGILPDPDTWSHLGILVFTIILQGPAAAAATLVFLRKHNRSFTAVGLAPRGSWVGDMLTGFILGTALIACIVFAGLITGQLDIAWNYLPFWVILRHGLILFALFALQCAIEELIFRGYPFQLCIAATNPLFGVILFSLLFGLLHLMNPNASILALLNTMAAGILLSVAFLKTRTLWLPIGIHWGWNFSQGFIFSVPVSGVTFPPDMFSSVSLGPSWLTGGTFGPEGGILALIVTLSASLILWRTERITVDKRASSGLLSGGE